jgi:hypothetical protein
MCFLPARSNITRSIFIFLLAQQPPQGHGILIHEDSILQRRTTVGRSSVDELLARRRDFYLTTHNTHDRHTTTPPVGFFYNVLRTVTRIPGMIPHLFKRNNTDICWECQGRVNMNGFVKRFVTCVGRVAYWYSDWLTGWTVRWSNPGGGEIFRTCLERPCAPPSLLYNGYRVFPGGKERPRRGQERVDLYLYSPCRSYGLYRASVLVQGYTLPFYLRLVLLQFVCIASSVT